MMFKTEQEFLLSVNFIDRQLDKGLVVNDRQREGGKKEEQSDKGN